MYRDDAKELGAIFRIKKRARKTERNAEGSVGSGSSGFESGFEPGFILLFPRELGQNLNAHAWDLTVAFVCQLLAVSCYPRD